MTLGGWITFLLSTISVTTLFSWCLYKVMTAKPQKDDDISGAFDIFEKE
ncbi:MAG: hypothetical protein J6K91_04705 [Opitutales bacterium]|nr:hypothetical protein [Opitutales bacterium]MBQ2722823.1 hypothetical protein [Opitutales bacterium]MBR7106579.1 hypothetical protein [Opitutales bacterium]